MTDCPSCGRYIGPYDACPSCGAALTGRTPVRLLKLAALILALGGLALLWWLATRTDVPTVEIGQVHALMNLAYVRVQGQVSRPSTYDPDSGYFSFWLADGTGELHVAVYRNESRTLINPIDQTTRARVPALGDRVTVEGTVRVREDLVSLTVNVPERLQVRRAEPAPRAIGEITAADALTWVQVRGQVRALRTPYPGLTLVGLRDGSGEIELAISEVVTALGGDLPALATGQAVQVVAPVSLYRDNPQLSLARAADLRLLDETLVIAPEMEIYALSQRRVGAWATVSGQVVDVIPFSSGVKYVLDDGSGRVTLLLWQDLHDRLPDPAALGPGATLRVQGQVAEYKGELEILPELPADLAVLAVTPSVESPSETAGLPELSTGDVSASHLGQTVQVAGVVQAVESFAQGFKFTLDDGSGPLVLLTWLDLYDGVAGREGLRRGASVQVTGRVDQFEGQMQVVPARAADLVVLAAGTGDAPERETGAVQAQDVGTWVAVTGRVTRAETFGSGARVFLDDGSGEVMVLLWQNLLDRLPEGVDVLVPGQELRVTGQVQAYRGTLEIVPVLPFDVRVADSG